MQFWIKGTASFFLRIISRLSRVTGLNQEKHNLTAARALPTHSIAFTHSFSSKNGSLKVLKHSICYVTDVV